MKRIIKIIKDIILFVMNNITEVLKKKEVYAMYLEINGCKQYMVAASTNIKDLYKSADQNIYNKFRGRNDSRFIISKIKL